MGAVTKTTRRCSSCRRHRASSAFSLPLSPSRLRHPPPSGEHPEWLGGNARSEAGSYGMPRGREVASEGQRRRSSESQLERKKERLLLCWRGNYVAAVFAFFLFEAAARARGLDSKTNKQKKTDTETTPSPGVPGPGTGGKMRGSQGQARSALALKAAATSNGLAGPAAEAVAPRAAVQPGLNIDAGPPAAVTNLLK